VCGRTACTDRGGGGRKPEPVGYGRAELGASRRPYTPGPLIARCQPPRASCPHSPASGSPARGRLGSSRITGCGLHGSARSSPRSRASARGAAYFPSFLEPLRAGDRRRRARGVRERRLRVSGPSCCSQAGGWQERGVVRFGRACSRRAGRRCGCERRIGVPVRGPGTGRGRSRRRLGSRAGSEAPRRRGRAPSAPSWGASSARRASSARAAGSTHRRLPAGSSPARGAC